MQIALNFHIDPERLAGARGHCLSLKHAQAQIVHQQNRGEGLDFRGLQLRYVRGSAPLSLDLTQSRAGELEARFDGGREEPDQPAWCVWSRCLPSARSLSDLWCSGILIFGSGADTVSWLGLWANGTEGEPYASVGSAAFGGAHCGKAACRCRQITSDRDAVYRRACRKLNL